MPSIQQRCTNNRRTRAFATAETIRALGDKMVGIVADRRVTVMRRYLDSTAVPEIHTGLRLWHGGFDEAVTVVRRAATIHLSANGRHHETLTFHAVDDSTEAHASHRYNHPEQTYGQRRDLTLVELNGFPGQPQTDDMIRIETWGSGGVGQETIAVFDDVEHVQELAWTLSGDRLRQIYLDDEWCIRHARHMADPGHTYGVGCDLRQSTEVEDLRLLVVLAEVKAAGRR